MKRMNLFVAAAVVALGSVLTSCSSTENAVPTITFAASAGEMKGDTLILAAGATEAKFTYTVAAEAEVKTLQAGITGSLASISKAEGLTTFSSDVITIPSTSASYKVKVVDKDSNEAEKTLYIKVKTVVVAAGAIVKYDVVLLGAQDNTAGSSFASSTGTVYSSADAAKNSAAVDFIFYNEATAKAQIFAPASATCTAIGTTFFANKSTFVTKNATKIAAVTMTVAEFDAIADDAVIVTKTKDIATDVVKGLAKDNVFAFITAAGKKGLAKVSALTAGDKGSITISVKVQK